ncbi:hypothetical protein [Paenibacillus sp. FSL R10-2736]|uniref:hypothetical protein n=1 Tax=Paenibacillus sp. FSL R10-2736 TaxID=2954692 RepID=UPI0030F9504C
MPVESQLKREFASFKQNTVIPEQLETQISASFDQYFKFQNERKTKRHMRGTARIAVVLCGLMLFGGVVYGAERLWAVTYGSTGIKVIVHSDYTESDEHGEHVKLLVEDIQTKLAVNESAFLYVSLPNGGYDLLKVNRPQLFSDIESWKEVIEPITGKLVVPSSLPEGYYFAEARSDSQLGIIDESWVKKYTNVLSKRVKPGEDYAWIKSFNTPNRIAKTVSPQLIYEGPRGKSDAIVVKYTPSGLEAQLTANFAAATTVEEMKVGALDALYIVNKEAYGNQNNYYAYIQWIELGENNEWNILHEVSTESPDVSKETLLKVAEGLR